MQRSLVGSLNRSMPGELLPHRSLPRVQVDQRIRAPSGRHRVFDGSQLRARSQPNNYSEHQQQAQQSVAGGTRKPETGGFLTPKTIISERKTDPKSKEEILPSIGSDRGARGSVVTDGGGCSRRRRRRRRRLRRRSKVSKGLITSSKKCQKRFDTSRGEFRLE